MHSERCTSRFHMALFFFNFRQHLASVRHFLVDTSTPHPLFICLLSNFNYGALLFNSIVSILFSSSHFLAHLTHSFLFVDLLSFIILAAAVAADLTTFIITKIIINSSRSVLFLLRVHAFLSLYC
uniref:Uncharacterized protein n=1 Tax=Trypanosoma vivax (strain Y486) TaxID=1055687 RepID=G0U0W3_TRYVY|nr:hypothetical protein, unlikely [Trypanosoma vivax Y486]